MTAQDIEDLQHAIWVAERASALSDAMAIKQDGPLDAVYAAYYAAAIVRQVLRRHGVQPSRASAIHRIDRQTRADRGRTRERRD